MQCLASRGYSMDSFARNRISPVVTSDELSYRAELRLLERKLTTPPDDLRGLIADSADGRLRGDVLARPR